MPVLIANVGTSDLSVKIDNYFIPVGFDRNEPNIDLSGLNENEQAIWERQLRQDYIVSVLCQELGVQVDKKNRYSFRELTQRIWEEYQQEDREEVWHNRLHPGRILGVVDFAIAHYEVSDIFLFITDQLEFKIDPLTQNRVFNKGYLSDTIILFNLLRKWFSKERGLGLKPIIVPKDLLPIDQDKLHEFYYNFFHSALLDKEQVILVSVKGGTPQMQTALKFQAMSHDLPCLLFIEPQLSVKGLLNGQPSECNLSSYWQYSRIQKYKVARQLLERWDFEGVIQILKKWNKVLTFLIEQKVVNKRDLKESRKRIDAAILALYYARALFNFDIDLAKIEAGKQPLNSFAHLDTYDSLLNLYTQCYIYEKELSQTANFLARLGSLYDGLLERFKENLGGNKYLDRYPLEKWKINIQILKGEFPSSIYHSLMEKLKYNGYAKFINIKSNRYAKRDFIDALITYRAQNPNLQQEFFLWQEEVFELHDGRSQKGIKGLLESLDYWIDKRNELVHDAKGISQGSIDEANQEREQEACAYEEILPITEKIICSSLIALPVSYRNRFIGTQERYLYSEIRRWIIAQLDEDISS